MIDNIEKEKNGNGLDKPLVDLLDTGYPLLQRLREQAPGTYKHSQSLMSLVESISIELGLDIQKMKVAALYHDCGKINAPRMFSENQLDGEDPYVELDPWLGSQIIRSHVADTVNILINDHNFPRDLIEIISQHHGRGLMQYFYVKAGEKEEDLERFSHKGTRPKTIEAMVLMIADKVEATSRSLFQTNKLDPKQVIESTITNLLDTGELDEVSIKLGDLKKIKEALARELMGTYQRRVEYPKLKGKKEEDN